MALTQEKARNQNGSPEVPEPSDVPTLYLPRMQTTPGCCLFRCVLRSSSGSDIDTGIRPSISRKYKSKKKTGTTVSTVGVKKRDSREQLLVRTLTGHSHGFSNNDECITGVSECIKVHGSIGNM